MSPHRSSRHRTPRELPVSQGLADLLDLFASGDSPPTPVAPIPSAVVVCVRDTPAGVQVFVTRQADEPGLAEKNRWSFPSAELSPVDIHQLPLAVWDAHKCARMLRMDNATKALNYFATAARAALELLGVLLAEDVDGRIVSATDTPLWEDSRRRLVARRATLGELLSDRDLKMRLDLLSPWLRWVNTPWQLRRHDAIYFICAVPHGQTVSFRSANESWGGWMTPAEVLEHSLPGEAEFISTPTRLVCEGLAKTPTVGSAMARVRDMSPVLPEIVRHDGRWWVALAERADPSDRGRIRDLDTVVTESDLEQMPRLFGTED